MQLFVKVADISNEMRPPCVASPWLDCLLTEFFNQVWMPLVRLTWQPAGWRWTLYWHYIITVCYWLTLLFTL